MQKKCHSEAFKRHLCFCRYCIIDLSVKSCLSVVALLILSSSCTRTLQDCCMYNKHPFSAIVFWTTGCGVVSSVAVSWNTVTYLNSWHLLDDKKMLMTKWEHQKNISYSSSICKSSLFHCCEALLYFCLNFLLTSH